MKYFFTKALLIGLSVANSLTACKQNSQILAATELSPAKKVTAKAKKKIPIAGASAALRLQLEGSSLQMGTAIGKHYKNNIHTLANGFNFLLLNYVWKGDQLALNKRIDTLYTELAQAEKDEIRGIALGSGVPLKKIQSLQLFYTLSKGKVGCRQFASWGKNTIGGKLIHSRNLDWPDYPGNPIKSFNTLINYNGKDQAAYLAITWQGFSPVLTGSNEHGITIGFNQLDQKRRDYVGEPTFFTIKRALRSCKTLEEIVQIFKKTRPIDSGSLVISSSKEKKAIVLEVIDRKVALRPAVNGMICNANHATTNASTRPSADVGYPVIPVATRKNKILQPEDVRQIMASKEVLQPTMNVLSVIFTPEDNLMLLSWGSNTSATLKHAKLKIFPKVADAAKPIK